MMIEQLEAEIEKQLRGGNYYDFTKLKIKTANNYKNLEYLKEEQGRCIFTFEEKTGHLFRFKNVLGGYFMTLSAAQLNGRFKEVSFDGIQKS